MTIYQDKNKRYYIAGKYKNQNTGEWISYKKYTGKNAFIRKRDAIQAEEEFLLSIGSIEDQQKVSFEEVMNQCFHDDNNIIKQSTIDTSIKRLRRVSEIFDKDIKYISSTDIKTLVKQLDDDGLSTNYINGILSNISKVFRYAVDHEYIEKSPTKVVKKITRPDEVIHRNQFWTVAQFRMFLNEVEGEENQLFFKLLFGLGCRKGEALCLRWTDISFENSTVHINKTLKGSVTNPIVTSLKNGAKGIRTISIPTKLLFDLKEHKKKQEYYLGFEQSWFIFGGFSPLSTTSLGRTFHAALSKGEGYCRMIDIEGEIAIGQVVAVKKIYYNPQGLGGAKAYSGTSIVEEIIPNKKFNIKLKSTVPQLTIHGLRHSHVTLCINNKANLKGVADRIGDTLETTLKVYSHLFTETDEKIAKLIDELIF